MSKYPLREDKTCLNCNHVVEKRFCPNCGQENTDTRKTFYHLFVHFFEDLTHYENAFWKTIINLLFKPAALTKEYLSGKRLSYLAPIRLYIFISFVTFLIISLLPDTIENVIKDDKTKTETKSSTGGLVKINKKSTLVKDSIKPSPQEVKLKSLLDEGKLTKKEYDTLVDYTKKSLEKEMDLFHYGDSSFKSIKELDSLQKLGKTKMSPFGYWLAKKLMKSTQNKSSEELIPKFFESFRHNIPKALFVYMPLFAFLLWLFHNKKKWYYFDHGIFTLHYFSFMLLFILITTLFLRFLSLFGENSYIELIDNFTNLLMLLWFVFYFYRASKNFYQGSRTSSFIKSSILLLLNTILLSFVLVVLIVYSLINIH